MNVTVTLKIVLPNVAGSILSQRPHFRAQCSRGRTLQSPAWEKKVPAVSILPRSPAPDSGESNHNKRHSNQPAWVRLSAVLRRVVHLEKWIRNERDFCYKAL